LEITELDACTNGSGSRHRTDLRRRYDSAHVSYAIRARPQHARMFSGASCPAPPYFVIVGCCRTHPCSPECESVRSKSLKVSPGGLFLKFYLVPVHSSPTFRGKQFSRGMQLNPVSASRIELAAAARAPRPHRIPSTCRLRPANSLPATLRDRNHPGLRQSPMHPIEQTDVRRRSAELLAADMPRNPSASHPPIWVASIGEVRQGQIPFVAPLQISPGCQEKHPKHRFFPLPAPAQPL